MSENNGIQSLPAAIGLTTSEEAFIHADWPAAENIHTLISTRRGGVSLAPFYSMNLAAHVGDNPEHVAENRQLFAKHLPSNPVWLNQVHGTHSVLAEDVIGLSVNADASYTRQSSVVCTVMSADCLPVLLTDASGSVVAAAHAGWRGLCNGVLESVLSKMQVPSSQIMAWLGPAIGADAFEVGEEVRQAFISRLAESKHAFTALDESKYLANIYLLARQRLQASGVNKIYGGDFCTLLERERFFSYRREHTTGRMASCIWRQQ